MHDKPRHPTFEEAYPRIEFAPLVRLALVLTSGSKGASLQEGEAWSGRKDSVPSVEAPRAKAGVGRSRS
jgi:hypothetical protein